MFPETNRFMEQNTKPQILIGAASSNSGKTTFTMGLLRALRERGLYTQPFKCGPDYIDPKYHTLAAGHESVNLDSWFSSPRHIRNIYRHYGKEADILVTEGVMGLFDGYRKMQGSSAEIAGMLDIPVLLIVNARSTAYSVAPLIYGFRHFCPHIQISGVIFNHIASESHFDYLRQACEDVGVPCFGYLPKLKEIELPSRHLGLTLESEYLFDEFSLRIAREIEKHVDLDRLIADFSRPFYGEDATFVECLSKNLSVGNEKLKIAVARDEAFNFTYRRNLDRLQSYGALFYFSPLSDAQLPESEFVYLPGGYPEFYLSQLSENRPMLEAVHQYIENGGKLWAECGGMMYLCQSIIGIDGKEYPMAKILPAKATMENMRLHLGYRSFKYKGQLFKGHEFHYSSLTEEKPIPSIIRQYNAKGEEVDTPVYRYKNALASYTHLYWGETNLLNLFTSDTKI